MADEKLHPEVEALIRRLPMDACIMEIIVPEVRAIALLAAEKAREEQREEDAKMGDELEDYLWHYGHPAAVNAIRDLIGRIRRGKQ